MKKRAATDRGYEKISATLEAPVLRQIRQRTSNVSGFLNEAAKRKLYFDKLRATDEEMGGIGIGIDERFYRKLGEWLDEVDARQGERARRPVGRKSAR